ncbi:hypothetical protein D9M71_315270 [compost metagenome]
MAVDHALGLPAANQAGEHLAQAVGGDAGQGQADFGAGLARRDGLGQVADQQAAGGIGFDAWQAIGVLRQLVTAGGQGFGGDDLASQGRLEEGQGGARVVQLSTQGGLGALVDGLGLEAPVAVLHQRLVDRRRQGLLVALLGRREGVIEMGALVRPAGGLVEAGVIVGQGGQAEEQEGDGEEQAHGVSLVTQSAVRIGPTRTASVRRGKAVAVGQGGVERAAILCGLGLYCRGVGKCLVTCRRCPVR